MEEALQSFGVRITIVVAIAGTNVLSPHAKKAVDDIASELNHLEDCCDVKTYDFKHLYAMVRESLAEPNVDVQAQVQGYGLVTQPYEAVYGRVGVSQVASWYESYSEQLFSKNIRKSLGLTKVNRGIQRTLNEEAENFWYFNNGVTVLCEGIDRSAAGSGYEIGNFQFRGASVVNGAQTVRAIYEATQSAPDEIQATVWLRAISLKNCPEGFAARVTEATNTQNRVEARDFASLDPVQDKIREDMALTLGKIYVIKRGEPDPRPESGCTIVEAARALTTISPNPGLNARAKQDDDAVLYEEGQGGTCRALFAPRPTAYKVWRSVNLVRQVRARIENDREKRDGRAASIADQSDALVAHLLFRRMQPIQIDHEEIGWDSRLATALELVPELVDRIIASLDGMFGTTSFPGPTFRNSERCAAIAQAVEDGLTSGDPLPVLPEAYWHSRRQRLRRATSVALIVDAGLIPDGTQLEFCGGSEAEEEKTGPYFLADDKRRRATWINRRSKPLLWEADGQGYSPSGLTKLILNDADIPTVAIQGTLRWRVVGRGSLVEIAQAIREG